MVYKYCFSFTNLYEISNIYFFILFWFNIANFQLETHMSHFFSKSVRISSLKSLLSDDVKRYLKNSFKELTIEFFHKIQKQEAPLNDLKYFFFISSTCYFLVQLWRKTSGFCKKLSCENYMSEVRSEGIIWTFTIFRITEFNVLYKSIWIFLDSEADI